MRSEVGRNPHLGLYEDRVGQVLWFERSAARLESEADLDAMIALLERALAGRPRRSLALVIDMRNAVGRNDPAFEQMMLERNERLFGGFRRVASLVKSSVGMLQVQRVTAALPPGAPAFRVFRDEDEALRWVSAST